MARRLRDANVDIRGSTETNRERNRSTARHCRIACTAVGRNFDGEACRHRRRVNCERVVRITGVLNRVDVNDLAGRGRDAAWCNAADAGVDALVAVVIVVVGRANRAGRAARPNQNGTGLR